VRGITSTWYSCFISLIVPRMKLAILAYIK
jgi:hypothetical protein